MCFENMELPCKVYRGFSALMSIEDESTQLGHGSDFKTMRFLALCTGHISYFVFRFASSSKSMINVRHIVFREANHPQMNLMKMSENAKMPQGGAYGKCGNS